MATGPSCCPVGLAAGMPDTIPRSWGPSSSSSSASGNNTAALVQAANTAANAANGLFAITNPVLATDVYVLAASHAFLTGAKTKKWVKRELRFDGALLVCLDDHKFPADHAPALWVDPPHAVPAHWNTVPNASDKNEHVPMPSKRAGALPRVMPPISSPLLATPDNWVAYWTAAQAEPAARAVPPPDNAQNAAYRLDDVDDEGPSSLRRRRTIAQQIAVPDSPDVPPMARRARHYQLPLWTVPIPALASVSAPTPPPAAGPAAFRRWRNPLILVLATTDGHHYYIRTKNDAEFALWSFVLHMAVQAHAQIADKDRALRAAKEAAAAVAAAAPPPPRRTSSAVPPPPVAGPLRPASAPRLPTVAEEPTAPTAGGGGVDIEPASRTAGPETGDSNRTLYQPHHRPVGRRPSGPTATVLAPPASNLSDVGVAPDVPVLAGIKSPDPTAVAAPLLAPAPPPPGTVPRLRAFAPAAMVAAAAANRTSLAWATSSAPRLAPIPTAAAPAPALSIRPRIWHWASTSVAVHPAAAHLFFPICTEHFPTRPLADRRMWPRGQQLRIRVPPPPRTPYKPTQIVPAHAAANAAAQVPRIMSVATTLSPQPVAPRAAAAPIHPRANAADASASDRTRRPTIPAAAASHAAAVSAAATDPAMQPPPRSESLRTLSNSRQTTSSGATLSIDRSTPRRPTPVAPVPALRLLPPVAYSRPMSTVSLGSLLGGLGLSSLNRRESMLVTAVPPRVAAAAAAPLAAPAPHVPRPAAAEPRRAPTPAASAVAPARGLTRTPSIRGKVLRKPSPLATRPATVAPAQAPPVVPPVAVDEPVHELIKEREEELDPGEVSIMRMWEAVGLA
ncbi:hypothetical protein GGF31_006284 [Allomyces arbusculus]|nr:hypothetical protein GGF31_006284 [Allomyces arbusculus]